MFYDNYVRLCNTVGKSPSAVAVALGLKKATVTRWKKGGTPTDANAQKIADYFGVTVDFLLGAETKKAPTPESERPISDDDIKFALFGGEGEVTDEMYEEVKRFAQMVKLREEAEKKKKG